MPIPALIAAGVAIHNNLKKGVDVDALKAGAKKGGDRVTDTVLDGLVALGNFFGAGSAVESLIRNVTNNPGLIPHASDIEAAIIKDLSKKKITSVNELNKLQNIINNQVFAKSSIQKEKLDDYMNNVRDRVKKLTAQTTLGDDIQNVALSKANSINYATTSDKRKLATQALDYAKKAAEAYEGKTDTLAVEQTL